MSASTKASLIALLLFVGAVVSWAQKTTPPRTILLDHNGNEVSNNEFVDIRMANFHYPDATVTRVMEDGTIEFRLQKIPQEGEIAPSVVFRSMTGEKFDLSTLRGKVVVLNFWFIGCASCRAHLPKLNDLRSKFDGKTDVVFLAVTADPASEVKRYLSREKFDFTQVSDGETQLKAFRFSGYPRNIVISKTGEIVYWRTAIKAWEKFESVIEQELKR